MNARSRRGLCLSRAHEKKGTKLWNPQRDTRSLSAAVAIESSPRAFCSIEFCIADLVPRYLTMAKNNFYSDRTVTYTTSENRARPVRGRAHSTRP
jgi:hypothetical protein